MSRNVPSFCEAGLDLAGPNCPGKIPVFDFHAALATCYGKPHLFQDLAVSFLSESDPLLGQLQAALHQQDHEQMAFLAHRLLNSIAYLGAAPAAEMTRNLERAARDKDIQSCRPVLSNLVTQIEELKQALLKHLDNDCPIASN